MKYSYLMFKLFVCVNAYGLSSDLMILTKTLNQLEQVLADQKESYFSPISPTFQLSNYIVGKKYKDLLGEEIASLPTWINKHDLILIASTEEFLNKYALYQIRVFDQYKHGCKFPGSCDMQSLKNILYGLELLDKPFKLDSLQATVINLLESYDDIFENVWFKYLHENFGVRSVNWIDETDLLKLIHGLKNNKLDTTKPPKSDKYAKSIIFLEFSDVPNHDYYRTLMNIDPTLKKSNAEHLGYFLTNQIYISDDYDIEYMFEQYHALYNYNTASTIGYGFLLGVGTHATGHEVGLIASKINNQDEYFFFDSMNINFLHKSNYQQLFQRFFSLVNNISVKPINLILPMLYYYLFDFEHNLDGGVKNTIAKAISLFKTSWKKNILQSLLTAAQFLEKYNGQKISTYIYYKPYFCSLIFALEQHDSSIPELTKLKNIFEYNETERDLYKNYINKTS